MAASFAFGYDNDPSGTFYELNFFGLAASVLSLAGNMVATSLIGCMAWCVTYHYNHVCFDIQ